MSYLQSLTPKDTKLGATIEKFIKQESKDVVFIRDHEPHTVPSFVNMDELIQEPLFPEDLSSCVLKLKWAEEFDNKPRIDALLVEITKKMLRVTHLNLKHPDYWNVVLYNKEELMVRKEGRWEYHDLKEWCTMYAKTVIIMYLYATQSDAQPYYRWVSERVMNIQKKIQEAIFVELMVPDIRQMVRNQYEASIRASVGP